MALLWLAISIVFCTWFGLGRNGFGFHIVNILWLSGDIPRLPPYGIHMSQLVRYARYCTRVLDLLSKNVKIISKLLTQGNRYHKIRKTFGKFIISFTELLSKFGTISRILKTLFCKLSSFCFYCFATAQWRTSVNHLTSFKNMFQMESLTRLPMVILSTN